MNNQSNSNCYKVVVCESDYDCLFYQAIIISNFHYFMWVNVFFNYVIYNPTIIIVQDVMGPLIAWDYYKCRI